MIPYNRHPFIRWKTILPPRKPPVVTTPPRVIFPKITIPPYRKPPIRVILPPRKPPVRITKPTRITITRRAIIPPHRLPPVKVTRPVRITKPVKIISKPVSAPSDSGLIGAGVGAILSVLPFLV